ncbi:MAG: hypothetical protein M5R36_09810 [Deltaproteobacteria bacterium]|nr:hypothetical protein [Deltaproteobacteria bacterium]
MNERARFVRRADDVERGAVKYRLPPVRTISTPGARAPSARAAAIQGSGGSSFLSRIGGTKQNLQS